MLVSLHILAFYCFFNQHSIYSSLLQHDLGYISATNPTIELPIFSNSGSDQGTTTRTPIKLPALLMKSHEKKQQSQLTSHHLEVASLWVTLLPPPAR